MTSPRRPLFSEIYIYLWLQTCFLQAVVTAEEAREGYDGPVYPSKEYILDDDECPLAILMNHSTATGMAINFQKVYYAVKPR